MANTSLFENIPIKNCKTKGGKIVIATSVSGFMTLINKLAQNKHVEKIEEHQCIIDNNKQLDVSLNIFETGFCYPLWEGKSKNIFIRNKQLEKIFKILRERGYYIVKITCLGLNCIEMLVDENFVATLKDIQIVS